MRMSTLQLLSHFLCFLFCFFHFQPSLSLSFPFNSSVAAMPCPHDQSHALLLFMKTLSVKTVPSTRGFPYPKTESWKEDTDCCSWDGITCDSETGNVIGLDLSHSFLYGTISSNSPLFSLLHLQKLDLSLNNFNSSPIVSQFGQFFKLTHLYLIFSNFVGQIPLEISYLSNLISLDLSLNDGLTLEATVFNSLVQNLTQLQELHLSDVNMSLVRPSSLMNFSSSLTSLELGGCGLHGKIPDISHLSKLVSLHLSANYGGLTVEPTIFDKLVRNLTNIRKLYLTAVNMSMVEPSSLINLSSSLSSLALSSSELKGKFPEDIYQRPKLQLLDLSRNKDLHGSIPRHIWNNSLSFLSLSFTQFQIYLDHDFINNFKSLEHLELISCNFRVSNLELLDKLTDLSWLDLSHNNFSGKIPSSLGNLMQLNFLDLSSNNFNGQIPSSFGNLEQLPILDLSHNNFSGEIPSSFGNLKQLQSLDLSHNNFSGEIPSSFGNLKQLLFLSLNNNNINGQIPNYIINFTQLYLFNLSNNKFTGPIPFHISRISSLRFLDLSSNFLNATIPSSLFTLPYLISLSLKNNQLTGHLGPFQDNHLLRYIDLRNNKLLGSIPSTVSKLMNLIVFILSSNKFIGEVSSEVCNLNSLQILDLSNNSLNGFIPQCLGNFSNNILVLHLGMNNFHGAIPQTFSAGSSLRYLNFNGNQLQTRIPLSITNCRDLEILDLGNNYIEDSFPHFLETLPELQILILKSNKFHGMVKVSSANYSFSKLRMFDLSSNMFTGPLPAEYFKNFKAMMNPDVKMEYMGTDISYDFSVSLTLKGLEIELVKIQTLLTIVDLSNNKFTREIPQSIGKLKALKLLNLSHNQLTGNIQPSLGNLSNLESLDLSSNLLVGRIPKQLTDLTFLQVFRVSYNRLEGAIPQGKQFNTFDNSSYEGNLGLCGFPLEKCDNGDSKKKPTQVSEEDDSNSKMGFGWKPVVAGYGCGVIFGVAIGYVVFKTRKPTWLVRMVEGEGRGKPKRFKNRIVHVRQAFQ